MMDIIEAIRFKALEKYIGTQVALYAGTSMVCMGLLRSINREQVGIEIHKGHTSEFPLSSLSSIVAQITVDRETRYTGKSFASTESIYIYPFHSGKDKDRR